MAEPVRCSRLGVVSLFAVVMVAAVCACRTSGPDVADPGAMERVELAAAGSPTLRFGTRDAYPGERLYDYMNGAAVTYLERNFRTMVACDAFEGKTQTKVEVYEMASAGDAAALYADLVAEGGDPLAVGDGGCVWQGFEPEGVFRSGRFFVRILAYAEDAKAGDAAVRAVAAALAEQLD